MIGNVLFEVCVHQQYVWYWVRVMRAIQAFVVNLC